MHGIKHYCCLTLLALQSLLSPLFAIGTDAETNISSTANPFAPFTGKVIKNKVRMRLQPNFESSVIKELSRDDLLIVVGENEEFYAVQPPQDVKAYIFRTFVLDNVVEGARVNIRLEPSTEAPIIGQLNTGDRVKGVISPLNSKWLEIDPPASTRFYVAKEYIEKIGDPSVMAVIARRRDEVNRLLNETFAKSSQELSKPYDQMRADEIFGGYKKIIHDYPEFTEQVNKAKEFLASFEDHYLRKKVAFLEAKNKLLNQEMMTAASKATPPPAAEPVSIAVTSPTLADNPNEVTSKMSAWVPFENSFYAAWSLQHDNKSMPEFYEIQQDEAITLQGILEAYHSSVKNKPGDYVIINPSTRLPEAYLYSTQVNLENYVGRQVSVLVAERPNRHFAFPAYFVLGVQ